MKLQFPQKIEILPYTMNVKTDDQSDGAYFNLDECLLVIGTKSLKTDRDYVFMLICHEIKEICHICTKTRYRDQSVDGNYKFFMDHKEFEVTNNMFASAIRKFIK